MWPFILTRTLTLEKPIVASKHDVLNFLHDPDRVIGNNAVMVSFVQDSSLYTVTERLPLVGPWAARTKLRSRWTKMTDGCDVEVHGNLGTRISNELRVLELISPEGTVLYYERMVVKGLFFLMPYITSRTIKTRVDASNAFAAKLQKD